MRHLSMFSGAGGSEWTARILGWETIGYVEQDEYCKRVLRARIEDGWFHDAPIHDDARNFPAGEYAGRCDLITAGFPCQPFSLAGKQGAGSDERDGWPWAARAIRIVRPPLVLLENVPGLVDGSHGYFGVVAGELASLGYDAIWHCVRAADVGAPHRRTRLFLLAIDSHADRGRLAELTQLHGQPDESGEVAQWDDAVRLRDTLPSTKCGPLREEREHVSGLKGEALSQADGTSREMARRESSRRGGPAWWGAEPPVGRVVDGLADGCHRLRALGNGWVPQQAVAAWCCLVRDARLYGVM